MFTNLYVISEINGGVRYVGYTVKPLETRLKQHLTEARSGMRSHKCNWLREQKLQVEMGLVAVVEGNGKAQEVELIAGLRRLGASLVNGTDGGDGTVGFSPSTESRAKMSAAQRKRPPPSAETLAKRSAALTGQKRTAETKAKMSAAQKGRKHTAAQKAANSKGQLGKKLSAETKARMSAARKGVKKTPAQLAAIRAGWAAKIRTPKPASPPKEPRGPRSPISAATRAKMSASQLARPTITEATLAKLVASHTGRRHTEASRAKMSSARAGTRGPPASAETRAKMSASHKARCARAKAAAAILPT